MMQFYIDIPFEKPMGGSGDSSFWQKLLKNRSSIYFGLNSCLFSFEESETLN